MADVINKTTHQYLRSVNTPEYPAIAWIINPTAAEIASAEAARNAARPPPVKSEEEEFNDLEARVAVLERA